MRAPVNLGSAAPYLTAPCLTAPYLTAPCLVALSLVALLAGCAGSDGSRCEDTSDCAASGGVCAGGRCLACTSDAECADYGEGAVCDEGSCAACGADGGCGCAPGQLACACRTTGSPCGLGLACVDGLCAECPDGARGCACRTGGDACDPGLACADRTCSECSPGTEGCDCDAAGGCGEGLACDAGGRCRSPASCEALRDAGRCPEGHACALLAGTPTCLDECEEGFRIEGGVCVSCGPDGCAAARCADLDCASVHRVCEVTEGAPACAGCEPGFREDETLHCVDERLCGGDLCPEGEMPMHQSDGSCACVPTPCGADQARNAAGACVTCAITCGAAEGETGAIHPLASGLTCICETQDGYFVPPGEDGGAHRCDDDGDGWIGATALAAERSPDEAIATNARCALRRAARVDLVNEYGQTLALLPCGDGLMADHGAVGPDLCADFGGLDPIVLVEPDRNDREDELAAEAGPSGLAPPYGAGRTFRAVELNALTRACSTEHADYNADGTADIAESQGAPSAARDDASRLSALSFFTELYGVSFVPGTGDGALVITERSRCASGFPLGYGSLDGGSTYWRGCHRQRDARFGHVTAPPGLDFAAFSCAAPSGACEVPVPSTGRPLTECPGGGACHATAPRHDACEPVTDWGPEWRGMHHHSQFRCTLVDDASSAPYAVPTSATDPLDPGGYLALQRCSLDATGGLSCVPSATGVGWAAVRFTPGVAIPAGDGSAAAPVTEVLGCVDEARASFAGTPWSAALCPAPGDPAITLEDDFGRLDCPCQATEVCDDGADDDCDGLADCADPDCDASACGPHGLVCGGGACACPGGTAETACGDGADNDCDGAPDCADLECGGQSCGPHGLLCIDSACACSRATELCNLADDDCDGTPDEGCPSALGLCCLSQTSIAGRDDGEGNAFITDCPAGSALVGFNGRSGDRIDRLQAVCAPLELVTIAGAPEHGYRVQPGSPEQPLSTRGGDGGDPFSHRCAGDGVVIRIQGEAGDEVDRFRFWCGRVTIERDASGAWAIVVVPDTTPSPNRGRERGTAYDLRCPAGSLGTGIRGRSRGEMERLGMRCQALSFSVLPP